MKWTVHLAGTTSARSGDMFSKAVSILGAFKEFWNDNPSTNWSKNKAIQKEFAEKLLRENVIFSNLKDEKAISKFVRQKSSHYEQFGLVDSERRITSLGELLLTPGKNTNYMGITNGNAAFLMGILNYKVGNYYLIRDFLSQIAKEGSMRVDYFKNNYMVGNPMSDEEIMSEINKFMPIDSYEKFDSLIPHQKGPLFNKNYYKVFNMLLLEKDPVLSFNIVSKSSTKFWGCLKQELFGTTKKSDVDEFLFEINQKSLALAFLKAKLNASIKEYWDMWSLNFESTGIFSTTSDTIYISKDFADIVNHLEIQNTSDIKSIPQLFMDPIAYDNFEFSGISLNEFVTKNREKEFDDYISENMSVDLLIKFLNNMAASDYYEIEKFFGRSANNPTYAEFIVTLAFYVLSGKKTNFIDSWNGSLSADNKPLHYATGSKPDSQFYIDEKTYIIETTIQEGQQQTSNEVAPISKHLYDDRTNVDKMAILFAKNIFDETSRQMKIQRDGLNLIYGENFKWLANQLESNISLEDFREAVINV